MTAPVPTILGTSGGLKRGHLTTFEFGPLMHYATQLAEVSGRKARWCHLGTAMGDQRWQNAMLTEAGEVAGVEMTHLNLFPKRSAEDLRELVLAQDVIWVSGGSIENLLALWYLHGLDSVFREAWEKGVVLSGTSAGSICWHVSATTNLMGPPGEALTNGLGFLPYSNGVHYEVELDRRERYKQQVASGVLGDGYAVENGTGLLYRGTELVEAVTEVEGNHAWKVYREGNAAVEEQLDTRVLPGAVRGFKQANVL